MFGRLLLLFRRLSSNRIITDVFLVLVTFVVLNILSGLIGNSAFYLSAPPWFKPIWESITKFVVINSLIIMSVIAVVSSIGFCFFGYKSRKLNKALTATDSTTELDDSLLRLLTNLVSKHELKSEQDLQKETQRLLHELLRDATRTILGEQNRGSAAILVPNSSTPNEEYLEIMVSHRITSLSVARTKYYIGEDELKEDDRGTEGVAFLKQHICIGYIKQKDGVWFCEDTNFINHDDLRMLPLYRSFVNVPIIGPMMGRDVNCLGIVSFYSQDLNTFDTSQAQVLLQSISRRIAAALSIYLQLVEAHKDAIPNVV